MEIATNVLVAIPETGIEPQPVRRVLMREITSMYAYGVRQRKVVWMQMGENLLI
ncbi:MAG: hypothetical protein IBX69_12150 [Anaerolineales bacterium]|nr:hypothetical protein [Anaerolineales bacterium]